MTAERWQRIKALYSEVCDLPANLRAQALLNACPSDEELRREVERLLDEPADGLAAVDHPPLGGVLRPFAASPFRLAPGDVLAGRFVIQRHLGSGGMGEVYEAEDSSLNARVAVKLINREISADPVVVARFRREIALARKVTHRSVCRVFDYFPGSTTSGGEEVDFLTMELLRGETLASYLNRERPLSLEKALPLIEQIAGGLDAAHQARILHRDLKGSNIFVSSDEQGLRIVITDFGLARSRDGGDTVVTGSAWAAGTPVYMSPEQLEGGPLEATSDIYSLGVLMYEMATGVLPHQGNSPLQVAIRKVKVAPRPPRRVNPSVDPAWELVILKCLAYKASDRYRSAAAMLEDLVRDPPRWRRPPLRVPSRGLLTAGCVAAAAMLGMSVWDRYAPRPLDPEAARYYREGSSALMDGANAKAARLLERALDAMPDFAAGRCRLAEAYLELDMRDRAQEEVLKAHSSRTRGSSDSLLLEGTRFMLAGQWDPAVAALEKRVAAAAPDDVNEARLDLARVLDRADRRDDAAQLYEQVIAADPAQPGPLLRLAVTRSRQGRVQDALPLLDRAESIYQTLGNPEGIAETALSRSAMIRSVPEALAFAESAVRLARDLNSPLLLSRAKRQESILLESKGDLEAAAAAAKEAVTVADRAGLASGAVNGQIDLGYIPFAQRKYEEAEKYFDEALQMAVRYRARRAEARARITLSQLYRSTHRFPEAVRSVDEALKFYRDTGERPMIAQSLLFRGDIFQAEGKFDEARKAYEESRAASEAPASRRDVDYRLAYLARQQHRYPEALRRYQALAEGAAQSGDRLNEQTWRLDLVRILSGAGRLAEAEQALVKLETEGIVDALKDRAQHDRAAVEFQLLRYPVSIARLERLRAQAATAKRTAVERTTRFELCPQYAQAGMAKKAIATCAPLVGEYAGRNAQLVSIRYSLALAALTLNDAPKAVSESREALRLGESLDDARNTWYSLLILARSLHLARDSGWRAARERASGVLAAIREAEGEEAVRTYLSRPIIAGQRKAVEALQ